MKKELLTVVKDQKEQQSVVVRVSAIRNASVKIVLQENPLQHVEVEGMRVVTNNRFTAEEIKSEVKVGDLEKSVENKN